jgi:hypothetical protein
MITSLRSDSIDLAIGLTEGWVAGLLGPQGQREKGYKIVGRWVQSPLRWAIVTGRSRNDVNSVADLQNHRKVGVSRLGSGSHIMAFVLAQQENWTGLEESKALDIVPLGPLADLIAGVSSNQGRQSAADFFMWEHFTTKPHFQATDSPLKKVGEIYTPWPSWHIAASQRTFPDPESDGRLAKIFEVLDGAVKRFQNDPEVGVKLLGTGELGCYYGEEDAREWLTKAEFAESTRGVDRQVLEDVFKTLQGAGVVDKETNISDGDGVIGIAKA